MCWWAARRLPGEPQRCLPSAKLPAHLWTSRSRDGLNEDLETILTMRINKLKTFTDAFGKDLCVSHKLTTKMQKSATLHRPRWARESPGIASKLLASIAQVHRHRCLVATIIIPVFFARTGKASGSFGCFTSKPLRCKAALVAPQADKS